MISDKVFSILSSVVLATSIHASPVHPSTTQPITNIQVSQASAALGLTKLKKVEKYASTQEIKREKADAPVITPAPAPKPLPKPKPKPKSVVKPKPAPAPAPVRTVTVTATAYTASCQGCSGTTATGINLNANPNIKLIAVDPNVIPLGKHVYVPGYGIAITGDTGGAIHGDRIDIYMANEQDALNWGVQTITLKILD